MKLLLSKLVVETLKSMEEDDQNNNFCFGDSDVFLDIKSIRYLNTIEEDTLGLAQNTNGIQNSLQVSLSFPRFH